MEIRNSMSAVRPREWTEGPTGRIYAYGAERVQAENEDGVTEMWSYTEIWFPRGEYELVRAGMLPPGVEEWTAELRRIERSALHDEADRRIAKAADMVEAGGGKEWTEYAAALRRWKMAVRATAAAGGFPQTVGYPEMPTAPE